MLSYELCKKLKDAGFPMPDCEDPWVCCVPEHDSHGLYPPTLSELLGQLVDVEEPFGLFEPYLWKDKIGDSLWHAHMQSSCGKKLYESTGGTAEEALANLYLKLKN